MREHITLDEIRLVVSNIMGTNIDILESTDDRFIYFVDSDSVNKFDIASYNPDTYEFTFVDSEGNCLHDLVHTILWKFEIIDGGLLIKGALNGILIVNYNNVTREQIEHVVGAIDE